MLTGIHLRSPFNDWRNILDRQQFYMVSLLVVVLIPYPYLEFLFSDRLLKFMWHGVNQDYEYLFQNYPYFAKPYIGGIVLQFLITIFGMIPTILHLYRSNDVVYYNDRRLFYILFMVVFGSLLVLIINEMMNNDGFSVLTSDGLVEKNSKRGRGLITPAAANNLAFISTAFKFVFIWTFLRLLVIYFFVVGKGHRQKWGATNF